MDKPKAQRLGKPFCHVEMLYIIQEHGGAIKRVELKRLLDSEGYSKYCIYEAFRRCEWQKRIWFEGRGNSPSQIVHLSQGYDENLNID